MIVKLAVRFASVACLFYTSVIHAFVNLPTSSTFSSVLAIRSTTRDEEITLNPIVASVKVSKTVEVFGLVKQMEADGETVTSLCVGEPDFPPPKVVLDAAVKAIVDGETRYTAVTGTAALRNAIAADLKRRKGLVYNPQTEIVVGNGVSCRPYVMVCVVAE
jgi:bifunctional aspartate aminotransferase and glutamate/aspartate-prephenate aminotransferase